VSDAADVLFIAEVSSNHHASLERCLAFVDRAAEIGCDGVKFQLFEIDRLFAPEVLATSEDHRKRRAWELPPEFVPHLARRARERDLLFSCTPFHLEAVEVLAPHADFLKIASYELLWEPLLEACGRTGLPVALSTGMATPDEVERAVGVLARAGCRELTLLHCVSGYPARAEECNLASIAALGRCAEAAPEIACSVGWSDHTVEPGVIHRAVHAHGARMVEFHLDLDGLGEEYAVGHCWVPELIEPVIRDVRTAFRADGDGRKLPAAREEQERFWRADPVDGLRPVRALRADFAA